MKALKILIVMLVLIMSVGAVCAAENITDDAIGDDSKELLTTVQEDITTDDSTDILKTTQNDLYTASEGSFTNLTDEINDKTSFDLERDYKFNNETDDSNGIVISTDNFALNGNGRTIDGNNQSRIFNITANNVTLSNLILTGGNAKDGGAIYTTGSLTLNNITFINNYASNQGGAIILKNVAAININNSRFTDNYGDIGSIYVENGDLNINNTEMTSNAYSKRGQIILKKGNGYIENATFANIFSAYTPALYYEDCHNLSIINSRFINLTSNMTAGALGTKNGGRIYIKNCEFINTASSKNAGAIIADIYGADGLGGNVTIINTVFENTSSGFGGAYMQYGGNLFINNTEFTNCHADFNGGAVYLSQVEYGEINNCNFTSNSVGIIEDYPTYGGAILCDISTLNINDSRFINNTASAGNAVYAYDSSYNIKNSVFENNTNALYTVFDKDSKIDESTIFNDDTISLNNTFYATIITGQGQQLVLLNNTISVDTLPKKFDLRDWGWVSPIRDQGWMGACWTFGMTGALESALLKAAGITTDFSENNMQNTMLRYSIYGSQAPEGGGNLLSTGYLLGWFGAFTQEADSYDELGKISPLITTNNDIHIQDLVFIPNNEIPNGTQLKLAIMKYGSIDVSYKGQSTYNEANPYYNPATYSQYVNDSSLQPSHAVSIVGWDDNFDASNFLITPPGNGAWIVKNSWSTKWGNNGYLYVSYYDKTLIKSLEIGNYATAIIVENTVPYNKNYQYDNFWGTEFKSADGNISYYNMYEALDDDLIAAVGTYFNQSGIGYKVEIFVNDVLKLTQEGISPYLGFHTIKLDQYIPIKKGDVFRAVITSNAMPFTDFSDTRVHYTNNISFVSFDGQTWQDCYDLGYVACLKVYTVADDCIIVDNEDITVDYRSDSYFTVKVTTADGHAVGAGAVVNFTINEKTTTVLTDEDGIAKIKITETPDTYTMTTAFNGKDYTNTVTVIQVPTPARSFAELEEAIRDSTANYLNLYDDYEFNNETDGSDGIVINKSNFVINGNGHTIDGNNQSRLFAISGNNITLNDLILINGYYRNCAGMRVVGSTLTLNNVTFINNHGDNQGGAIGLDTSTLICNNTKFIDSYAEDGPAILVMESEVKLYNSYITSKNSVKGSQIYLTPGTEAYIENTTFANIASSYAPALNIRQSKASIVNSKFINLTANITAGAIATKTGGELYIENCEFENVTSSKNGGAIFVDITGSTGATGNVTIIGSKFKDTYSEFGGAYVQLGGDFVLKNTEFINSQAKYNGGAVYVSYTNTEIDNCTFDSNGVSIIEGYPTYGGAIYCDMSTLNITDSKFFNNLASAGSAIYAYDNSYNIKNSTFENNTNPIYTVFDKESVLENNAYINDGNISQNNTYYSTIIIGEGLQLVLLNNTISVDTIPKKFDLRDWGWVSSVKNQAGMGACWTFGMTGTLESALLKAANITTDFSENNMQNTMLKYSIYGCNMMTEGGANVISTAYLLSWLGAFTQDADIYDEVGKISPLITTQNDIHIQDVMFTPNNEIPKGTLLKLAIMNYGSIDVAFYGQATSEEKNPYYNPETHAHYVNESIQPSHAVSIIGWDDNYDASNFLITPPGNGAWIVKNSYGTSWGENGFFYISYYDKTLLNCEDVTNYATSIIIGNTEPYNKNYQRSLIWGGDFQSGSQNVSYMNIFEALDDDLIAAVGTYFNQEGMNYTVEIYVNDELKLIQTGVSPYFGYHTIKLNKYIPIKEGDVFKAVITSNAAPTVNLTYGRAHYTQNTSFISFDGGSMVDSYDLGYIACLKVYTVADDTEIINNKNITVDYGSGSYFTVQVVTADGRAVGAGAAVNFTINGKTTTAFTDDDGIAKVAITDVPGTYEVTTAYNGESYKNSVAVKLNPSTCKITQNKNIKVDYDGGKYFSVKIVSKDGKVAASGVSVKFTINGKTKTVKTDKNGIAKIKITDIPKKYTMKTTYNGKTVKNTVTVKQVLKAKKVTVKKTAKKLTLKATLKINGKKVKGKKITFKINGKTYKAKTNKKGIAKVTIKKKVIKKLKKGKKYTVKVTYKKDTIKTTVKVK